jgi:Cys-tRNA(Pro)/Cys-tRNA(Cys) deacylase
MAKKSKLKKTLPEQILDRAKIPYESLIFEDFSDKSLVNTSHGAISKHEIYKTLALIGNMTGPIIGIIPVDMHLDEKKLAKASGNKKVSMLHLVDLEKTTGYIHGTNNPVGIHHTKKFPIFIDNEALKQGEIIVSAGELHRSVKINAKQLGDFVQATFTDLT